MSLLLDALKKSEAQRKRGQVPTLSTDIEGGAGDGAANPGRGRVALWTLLAVIPALVLAAYVWPERLGLETGPPAPTLTGVEDPAESEAADSLPDAPPSGPRSDSSSAPQPGAGARRVVGRTAADRTETNRTEANRTDVERADVEPASADDGAVASVPTDPPSAEPSPEVRPDIPPEVERARQRAALAARVAQRAREGVTTPRALRRGPATTPNSAAPAPASNDPADSEASAEPENEPDESSDDGTIRPWQLPQAQRSEFPELDLTVHFYADRPADRFVRINGERFGEGGRPADGVRIGEIRPRGVVIDFRNYRVLIE